MKKFYSFLALAILAMSTTFAHAESIWDSPEMEGLTLDQINVTDAENASEIYLFNVTTKSYMAYGGGSSGNQVSVMETGNIVKLIFDSNNEYRIAFADKGYVYRNSTEMVSDGASDNVNGLWTIKLLDGENNSYFIQEPGGSGYAGRSLYVARPGRGNYNYNVKHNRNNHYEWKICQEAQIEKYNAKVELHKMMTIANELDIDLTVALAAYNSGSTTDISNATTAIKASIAAYSGAPSSSVDMTGFIKNAMVDGFTGNDYGETSYLNIGQISGWNDYLVYNDGNNSDSDMLNMYAGAPEDLSLSNAKAKAAADMYQVIDGLPAGKYTLQAWTKGTNAGIYAQIVGGTKFTTNVPSSSSWTDTSVEDVMLADGESLRIGFTTTSGSTAYADNFRLTYLGSVVGPVISVSLNSVNLTDAESTTAVTVSGTNLNGDITVSSNTAGVLIDNASSIIILEAEALAGKTINVSFNSEDIESSVVDAIISLTSTDAENKTVEVYISADSKCFIIPEGNLVPDPYQLTLSGFTKKSGVASITTEEAYCGRTSLKISGRNNEILGNNPHTWDANTTYVFEVMVKTNNSSTQAHKFSFNGVNISPENGGTNSSNWEINIASTESDWIKISSEFTTGANPTTGEWYVTNWGTNLTNNSVIYIDNWVLYKKDSEIEISGIAVDEILNVLDTNTDLTFTVKGVNISEDITITYPENLITISKVDNTTLRATNSTLTVTPEEAVEGVEFKVSYVATGNGSIDLASGSTTSSINFASSLNIGTSIESADIDSLKVLSAKDAIVIISSTTEVVTIYSITGQLVKQVDVKVGKTLIPLDAGFYIINGKKVIVR